MRRGPAVFLLAFSLFNGGQAAAQIPDVRVVQAGFPAARMTSAVARDGQWTPIVTELRLAGSGVFQGSLRVVSEDLDGDLVEYFTQPVVVNAEAGPRRFWTYAVGFQRRTPPSTWTVDVLDEAGAVLARLPVPASEWLSNDDALIVDISPRPIIKLRSLEPRIPVAGESDEEKKPSQTTYRKYCVSFLEARNLPDRWLGLESVDTVVWDLPVPGELSENQLQALIEWVRRGGKLVVGIGANWAAIRDSALAEIMPMGGEAKTLAAAKLRLFQSRFVNAGPDGKGKVEFDAPISVGQLQAARESVVVFRDQVHPVGTAVDLVSVRCIGAGRVTATAASLRDLTSLAVTPEFYGYCLDVVPLTTRYAKLLEDKRNSTLTFGATELALFAEIATRISFQGQRTLFVLAVLAFVALYTLVATAGSWWWLQRRSLLSLSWTVFAGLAVVASVAGLLLVSVSGGLRQGVHSVHVVSQQAADRWAACRGWYGYGSALRQLVNLHVGPAEDAEAPGSGKSSGFVRAMAMPTPLIATFATPARYQSDPAEGGLAEVVVRATLKQFEGAWAGTSDGSVLGQLTADRSTGRLTDKCWIRNDLPYAIRGGYVLYLDPRSRGGTFGQLDTAGTARRHWRRPEDVPPAMNVLAAELSQMKPGEQGGFARALSHYQQIEVELAQWSAQPAQRRRETIRPDLATLRDLQQYWVRNWSRLPVRFDEDAYDARVGYTMLESTRNLFLSNSDPRDMDSVGQLISSESLPNIDASHELVRGQALLLLVCDEPGPPPLRRGERVLRSSRGWTLYRIRIPIQLVGEPPPAAVDEDIEVPG